MNRPPTRFPRAIARMAGQNGRPNVTVASAPVTMASGIRLEVNQIVNRSRGRPCR